MGATVRPTAPAEVLVVAAARGRRQGRSRPALDPAAGLAAQTCSMNVCGNA
jgi:hypothetical protein